MDIMLGFEPSGVGSIPAGPAKIMIITPVTITTKIFQGDYSFSQTKGIPIRAADSSFILKQLGIEDMQKDISMLVGLAQPKGPISIHRDSPLLDGSPIKWSLLFVPADEEVDIEIEIVKPKENVQVSTGTGPLGYQRYFYNRNDCELLDSFNLKNGSCYFDPTTYWHGLVNHLDRPQYVFSLRSGSIEIEQVLSRLK